MLIISVTLLLFFFAFFSNKGNKITDCSAWCWSEKCDEGIFILSGGLTLAVNEQTPTMLLLLVRRCSLQPDSCIFFTPLMQYMFSVSDPRVLLLCKLWNLFHVKAWLSETNCLILKHLKETFTRLTRPEVAVCNYFPTQLLNEGILSESISPARLLLIHRKWESLTKERPSGISLQVFIERHCSFRSRL